MRLTPADSAEIGACPCCKTAHALLPNPAYTACAQCGHRWRAPLATANSGYYEALAARNDTQTPWFLRKTAERAGAVLALLSARTQRVLEVGCAEGALGQAVKAGCPVVYEGIELSRDRELARQVLDRVFSTPCAAIQSPAYDLIVSFHVLEHIAEPEQELLAWSRLLTEDGKLLIEVPNQAGHPLLASDRNAEHLHQFTPASLTLLLARCGFTCERLTVDNYESPVYPDSIRVVARRQVCASEQRAKLLQRFRDRVGGPFLVYGIGGDFLNYVEPLVDELELAGLIDSSPTKWGQRFGRHTVVGYAAETHADLPILICSIRFGADIRQQLLAMGLSPERLVGLERIYEDA